jgi:hypothetical protein
MARQRRSARIRTEAEIQEDIQKLQQETQQLQTELTQLRAGGATTNQTMPVQAAQTQTAPAQPTKARMVNVSLRIPEEELQPLNYCTKQYRLRHPEMTETEARGVFLKQGVHTARPRIERQAQAWLEKQQQTLQQRAGAA